jgi:hypothetical protein
LICCVIKKLKEKYKWCHSWNLLQRRITEKKKFSKRELCRTVTCTELTNGEKNMGRGKLKRNTEKLKRETEEEKTDS